MRFFRKPLINAAIISIIYIFYALILVLSDPLYSIETLMFLVVIHWSVVLIADLIYVIKWCK